MIELKDGWLKNQINHTEVEIAAQECVKEIVGFCKRKEEVPSREEMYKILKSRSLQIQSECKWEDYWD